MLDPAQLKRIESVHKGFLYQHLYAVGCLFLAQSSEVNEVLVELDEDVELSTDSGRVYVQVKTRSRPLTPGDAAGALRQPTKSGTHIYHILPELFSTLAEQGGAFCQFMLNIEGRPSEA